MLWIYIWWCKYIAYFLHILVILLGYGFHFRLSWLLAYLWLPGQAFAGMELRFFLLLDVVTDVTILEVPGWQMPSRRLVRKKGGHHIYPNRGWIRGGSQVFLETGVTQLGHECLLSAPGGLPLLEWCEHACRRKCLARPSPLENSLGATFTAHERHHLFSGPCLH